VTSTGRWRGRESFYAAGPCWTGRWIARALLAEHERAERLARLNAAADALADQQEAT